MTNTAHINIDLDAVKHNLAIVRDNAPNSKVMAVIKANAYGHGVEQVAKALRGVDGVAVARASEAIKLRKVGLTCKINVLEGFVSEQELEDLIRYGLDAVIHSCGQIDILEKHCSNKKISVWLKLDSGMSRLGFKESDFSMAHKRLAQCSVVEQPVSLMTHFSSADDRNRKVTQQQISLFNKMVEGYSGDKNMANSAAILAHKDALTDWVRPGLMLYGVSPFADCYGNSFGLKAVMSFHSRLISVKIVAKNESIGYSGTWVTNRKTRLGIVAIGYADGYPRAAKSGTPVLVNGKRVPLLGRVSMDMITVDLSSQPHSKAGDKVILWGCGLAIEEIAEAADTIPYTLLCGITQRVRVENI